MQLSLLFFGADSDAMADDRYRLFLEASKLADTKGLTAVWVPERHFQRFGGLYGSASVTAAALAVTTKRIGIRAGSVVFPLNDPLRVAEEWAMIDNLSGGRVALAAASGWHAADFVLAPDVYKDRRQLMLDRIETVRRLWRGETISLPDGEGKSVEVGIRPSPIQKELPMWLTATSTESFKLAGELGFNVLTASHVNGFDLDAFLGRNALYRETIQKAHGKRGHVTLMLHSYVGASESMVETIGVPALVNYVQAGAELSGSNNAVRTKTDEKESPERAARRQAHINALVETTVKTNVRSALSLIGTKEACAERLALLEKNGVDEVAALIDFGVAPEEALAGLERLAELPS